MACTSLMAYNAGSNQDWALNTSRVSVAVNNSVNLSNLDWCPTCGVCNNYNLLIDSYFMNKTTEAEAFMLCYCTSDLSDNSLINLINRVARAKSEGPFLTLSTAMNWAITNGVFVTNQNYPQIVTSGNTLNLDAGLPSSYPKTGTVWYDLTKNPNNNGTLVNGVTYNSTLKGFLSFNGSNQYVSFTTPTNIPISNSNYTISVWFSANTLGTKGLVGWGDYGTTNQVNGFRLSSSGLVNYWQANDLSATIAITTGSWYNAVATFDGTTRGIWVNGTLISSDTPTGHNVPNANNLTIGVTNTTEYFSGSIGEVQIFNRGLTSNEIVSNYNALLTRYNGSNTEICIAPTYCLTCSSSVVPPTTINGITITETHTGSVGTYPTEYTSCGTVTTPANSIWLGQNGAFTYTMNFSSAVNNIIIFMTGAGTPLGETFVFTTNTGTGIPTITSNEKCYTTIVGNQITSGVGAPGQTGGGGGKFLINNSSDFTSLTISGDGGESGTLFSICSNSIQSTPLPCDINYSVVANEGGACGLYIQDIPACQAGSLTAGALASSSGCTVGTYVIDWYLNSTSGTAAFTSGSAISAATDVTVVQPFTNEPVEGGNWYPVVRYVFLNGVKYTSDINLVSNIVVYSPDLGTVINPLCAESYNCSSGTSGNTYPVTISYLNETANSNQANRSVSWTLGSTNKYFAWKFYGYTVYDTLKISYVSPSGNTTTQLEYWKVGEDAGTTNLNTNPKVYNPNSNSGINLGYLAMVTPLTGFTYTNGDYLLIDIGPNPEISNTNWQFNGKCLTDDNSLGCSSAFSGFTGSGFTTNNVGATFDSANCQLTVTGLTRTTPVYSSTTSNNNFFKYNGSYIGSSVNTSSIPGLSVSISTGATYQYQSYVFFYCTNQNAETTVQKTGNTILLTFANSTDYNMYKTQYATASASTIMTNYTTNTADINYYKFYDLGILSGTTCGDSLGVNYNYTTHISSPFTFNDVNKTITVVLVAPTNGLSSGVTCNTSYSTVQSIISQINGTISASNYNITTYVRRGDGTASYTAVGAKALYVYSNSLSNYYTDYAYITPKPNVCQSSLTGWLNQGAYYNTYAWYVKITITNSADPANNFTLENYLNSSGVPGTLTLIYQKTNGVVVYP